MFQSISIGISLKLLYNFGDRIVLQNYEQTEYFDVKLTLEICCVLGYNVHRHVLLAH